MIVARKFPNANSYTRDSDKYQAAVDATRRHLRRHHGYRESYGIFEQVKFV